MVKRKREKSKHRKLTKNGTDKNRKKVRKPMEPTTLSYTFWAKPCVLSLREEYHLTTILCSERGIG